MLGFDTIREAQRRGHEVLPLDRTILDISDRNATHRIIGDLSPDALIHCAGWTDVDAAEKTENIPLVKAANTFGTRNLAEACSDIKCKMVFISTDYVFDGTGKAPWEPDCKEFEALSVYGKSKLEGELAVSEILDKYFVVRTAWMFGINGRNFVTTMLRLGKSKSEIRVVSDQIGTPTYSKDLAKLLIDMVETEKYGYYHATNEGGFISWYDFACEIFRQVNCRTVLIPVTTAEYGMNKAVRPFNSRLDKSKLSKAGFLPLPTWEDALHRYLIEIGEVDKKNG